MNTTPATPVTFARQPHGGYLARTHTGRTLHVERRGARWVAWARGQQQTAPMRTRRDAVALALDPVGFARTRDDADARWAAQMGKGAERTAAARKVAARKAAWAARAAKYEGLDEILAGLDWPTHTGAEVPARLVPAS